MDEQAKKPQREKATKEPSKRGRKALDKQTKRHYTIGSFKFTESEKRAYDALYQASGMSNQTEFFRKIIFEGGLKLYFSDKNTLLIYEEITSIQREISKTGHLFNQVTARVNANASDKNLFSSLNELKILLKKNEQFIREVQVLVEKLIEHSDDVRDETGIKFSELLVSPLPKSQT